MFVLPVASSHRRAFRGSPYAFAHLLADCALPAAEETSPDTARVPAIDVLETDSAYSVVLDMPGVDRGQLSVSVEGRRVVVSTGALPAAATPKADEAARPAPEARLLYRERNAAAYARTVVLPAEVDPSASLARFDNGVLTLTLPKRVVTGARQITVN